MRRSVRMREERMIVPRDGPVDLVSAEWRVCVEVANADGLHDMLAISSQKGENAYSAKYQAPITLAQDILSTPLATIQLQNQTHPATKIAQFAQALTCHSNFVAWLVFVK